MCQDNIGFFNALLTVLLGMILVNNQLDAQFFSTRVYFDTVRVSINHVVVHHQEDQLILLIMSTWLLETQSIEINIRGKELCVKFVINEDNSGLCKFT